MDSKDKAYKITMKKMEITKTHNDIADLQSRITKKQAMLAKKYEQLNKLQLNHGK